MKKSIATPVLLLGALLLTCCGHAPTTIASSQVAAPPPVMAPAVTSGSDGAGSPSGWVSGDGESQKHWLACRKTRRLCQVLMPKEAGESPDDTVFKHTLCQLYLRFECPREAADTLSDPQTS